MYIGIVSPIALLNKYSKPHKLQYCYCDLAQSSLTYLDFYLKMSKAGRTIFLDLSPVMPRSSRGYDPSLVVSYAKVINPSYIVLPCFEYSHDKTVVMAQRAVNFFKAFLPEETQYMGLPQGTTKEEVIKCIKDLQSIPGVSSIGMSASLELVAPRSHLLDSAKDPYYLDVYNSVDGEIPPSKVKGWITSFPIRLGIEGKRILDKCSQVPLDFSFAKDSNIIRSNVEDFLDVVGGIE